MLVVGCQRVLHAQCSQRVWNPLQGPSCERVIWGSKPIGTPPGREQTLDGRNGERSSPCAVNSGSYTCGMGTEGKTGNRPKPKMQGRIWQMKNSGREYSIACLSTYKKLKDHLSYAYFWLIDLQYNLHYSNCNKKYWYNGLAILAEFTQKVSRK